MRKNGFANYIGNNEIEFPLSHTFAFSSNLEQSYPIELLYEAILSLNLFKDPDLTLDDFYVCMEDDYDRYAKLQEYVDVMPSKVKLASTIASIIRTNMLEDDPVVVSSELGDFVKFVKMLSGMP